MDPLSLTASIITVLHLAHRVSILCLNFHSSIKSARKDFDRIIEEVNSLRSVLEGFARLVSHEEQDSINLQDLEAVAAPDGPLSKCRIELEELEAELHSAKSPNSKFGIRSISWTLKEKDVNRRLDRIDRAKQALQLAIALDQTVVLLKSRTDHLSLRATIDDAAAEQLRHTIIHWLGAPFPSSTLNDAQELRTNNTGDWFLRSDSFERWKRSPKSVMWLTGIPGCGKTVLCSSIIEDLGEECKSGGNSMLLYYFFDFAARDKHIVSSFLHCLLSQAIVQRREIPEPIHSLYVEHKKGFQHPSDKVLLNALYDVLNSAEPGFLIVDGMDECSDRQALLDAIETILGWQLEHLHILAVSREEKDIDKTFTHFKSEHLRLEGEKVNEDIRQYIQGRVQKERWLKKWPAEIQQEIISVVAEKAGDMFRLATLQLNELRKCGNLKSLRKVLHSLPTTLDETYSRILGSIEPEVVDDALKILYWLCFAFDSPTIDEIAEVLAVDLETQEYDLLQRMPDPEDLMSICGSLVIRTGDSGRHLKLSHFSVKEYLISTRIRNGTQSKYHITSQAADISIAKTCLIYLKECKYRNQEEANAKRLENPLTRYATDFWSSHFNYARQLPELSALALELFDQSEPSFLDWGWLATVAPTGLYVETPRPSSVTKANIPNVLLYYTALIGSVELIDAMLQRGANINAEGGVSGTALIAAVVKGNISIVQTLLERGANVNVQMGYYNTALKAAAVRGDVKIAELLISYGADVNACGGRYYTALHAAVRSGIHRRTEGMVELLLANGAKPDLADVSHGPPVYFAACWGLKDVVRLLIDNNSDNDKINCLQQALRHGHLETADFLLSIGADIRGDPLGNSVVAAVVHSLDTLRFLIEQKSADPIWTDYEDRHALHMAAIFGSIETIQYLLDLGVDVNDKDARGWTAVHYAALASTSDGLKLLLPTWRPEKNSPKNIWTPLHLACQRNHPEALDLLIGAGVQPTIVTTTEPQGHWTLYELAAFYRNRNLISPDGEPLHTALNAKSPADPALEQLRNGVKSWVHPSRICDGCQFGFKNRIIGPVFHCEECPDFDYCFVCKLTADISHPHSSWTMLETPCPPKDFVPEDPPWYGWFALPDQSRY